MSDPRTPVQLSSLGPVQTVPLWPLTPDGLCTCTSQACHVDPKKAGKHPRSHGALAGGGYGIYTGDPPRGSGVFVVDTDEKSGISGIENLRKLCAAFQSDIPHTFVVSTGGGGFHFYFRCPQGRIIKDSRSALAPGVDIKGHGGFVVGPGSPHRSGRPYAVVHDAPVAYAPQWLLDWSGLYRADAPEPTQGPAYVPTPIDCTTPEGMRRMEAFRSECAGETGAFDPAIQGRNGSDRLFAIAKRGACYWVLPMAVVGEIISLHFNPRCVPPWDEYDIQRKVREAVRTIDEPTGPIPEHWGDLLIQHCIAGHTANTHGVVPREHDPAHQYAITVGDCIANGKLPVRPHSEIIFRLRRDPAWMGVLRWDEFFDTVRAVDPPVKLDAERADAKGLAETDVTAVRVWFEVCAQTSVAKDTLWDCIHAAAKVAPVHPVRAYFDTLPMGDVTLFEELAGRLFGSNSALDREIITKFLVGAVRRILTPGCDMHTMLVLFGPQGVGKSRFVRALFGRAFSSEQMPDIATKDGSQQIATVWGQEIGELDKFLRVDPSTAKDYISRCYDTYRPAYGRSVVVKPRQCVFVGTTNRREMLRDPTGERRYWIIHVLRTIDIAWVEANRDAIWAAALALAATDYKHHMDEGSDVSAVLRERQAGHAELDAWDGAIRDYCAGRETVTVSNIFQSAIQRNDLAWISRFDGRAKGRISGTLTRMGCTSTNGTDYTVPLQVKHAAPSSEETRRRVLHEGLRPTAVAS